MTSPKPKPIDSYECPRPPIEDILVLRTQILANFKHLVRNDPGVKDLDVLIHHNGKEYYALVVDGGYGVGGRSKYVKGHPALEIENAMTNLLYGLACAGHEILEARKEEEARSGYLDA